MKKIPELKAHNGVRLTTVSTRINIEATPENVWESLSKYGNVSTFHAGVELSVPKGNSTNKAEMGAERVCDIRDGKREIQFTERITEYEEGSYYRYEVFEWKNFPLKMMFFAFAVGVDSNANTTLTLEINYRLKPGFLTGLMKGKMKRLEKSILLGYKNYIETSQENVPIEVIEKLNYQFA